MADYKATDTEFTVVANAIRAKGGTSAQLEWPSGFANAIADIPSGGGGGAIQPYAKTSPESRYIDSSGAFDPQGYSNNTLIFFEVVPNKSYLLYLPADVAAIRVASYDTDLKNYTGPGRYSGQLILNTTPQAYGAYTITPTNNYLVVGSKRTDANAYIVEADYS